MRAGDLRHRITIQRPEYVQDQATGEMTPSWVDVSKVWASVSPLSARDLIAAAAIQSKLTARVVIRYRAGIDSTMRIVHRGEFYSIEGRPLEDPKSGIEYLTILVSREG
ncbi:phage head closure protein [Pseudomonas sp. PA-7-1E]|uniref:phage head closure protein n=1 Tax=unclassified Pseudomonas TaxID=196821 RepID=UPI0006D4733F|nr:MULTISPECIES: phage head closure protein [unclassified Pseudomonas]MCF5044293.1 phage head closure protein [Pseudomonas sp. PA-7-1E]MCF5132486.1 phage head closure protein [Pseudomonas sp. PA-6-4F]